MNALTVTYDCCGASYTFPTTLADDETMLHAKALTDTVLMITDASHDAEHPECLQDEAQ